MITIEYASILIAILLSYIFLYFDETRWKRIIGCIAILITSVALGIIADTIPLYILMMINMAIALIKITEDVGEILNSIK